MQMTSQPTRQQTKVDTQKQDGQHVSTVSGGIDEQRFWWSRLFAGVAQPHRRARGQLGVGVSQAQHAAQLGGRLRLAG